MVPNLGQHERDGEGTSEFPPGTILAERYRILSTAGRGGMGLVYKVEQIFVNKILALKTINGKELSDTAVRRFQHEARATFAVSHPNIVCVHDFGLLDPTTPFLVMDFVEGETLSQVVAHSGSGVPAEQAIPIFIQVCFGLAAAHDAGIVHRDLKPSNILVVRDAVVGAEGSVKIVDFGIARLIHHDGGEIQALTRTGEIFGSPLYMSPEQCKSGKVDHRSDIYSLGCVLFETLTGAPPFIGDSALTTMMQHQLQTAPSLKQASLGKEFPAKLEAVLAKMLAKEPNDRYQNLGIVAHALAAVYGSASAVVAEQPPKRHERSSASATHAKTVTMSKTVLVFLFVAVAAMFAAGGYFVGTGNRGPARQSSSTNSSAAQRSSPEPPLAAHVDLVNSKTVSFDQDDDAVVKDRLAHPDAGGELTLTAVAISRRAMKLIADSSWVVSCKLNYCQFANNEDLELLAHKPNFEILFVSDTNFNDDGAKQISRSQTVTRLEAARTLLTDVGLAHLSQLRRLQNLQLSQTNISDKGLAFLANSPKLDVLRMENCRKITNAALAPLVNSRISSIDLSSNKQLNDGVLAYAEKMRRLSFINLEGTGVTAKGVDRLFSNNKRLYEVALTGTPHISAQDLVDLKAKFPTKQFSDQLSKVISE